MNSKRNFLAVVVMVVVVVFVIVGDVRGATVVWKFEDLVSPEPGASRWYVSMDLGSNLEKIDFVTGLPVVVPKVGVWHLGIFKMSAEGWLIPGGGASTDNGNSNDYPGYEGWFQGYAYDSVFPVGASPDELVLAFVPEGVPYLGFRYNDGRFFFSQGVELYGNEDLLIDGQRGDVSSWVFSPDPNNNIRIPDLILDPLPFSLPLTWDGSVGESWASAHWEPGLVVPEGGKAMIVGSGSVDVLSDLSVAPGAALSVDIYAGARVNVGPTGRLAVSNELIVGGLLDVRGVVVAGAVSVSGGALTNERGVASDIVIVSDVSFSNSGVLAMDVVGSGADRLVVDGSVSLGGGLLGFAVFGCERSFVAGTYTLIEASGGVSGEFFRVTDLGAYVSVNGDGLVYDEVSGRVTLTLDMDLHPGDANLDGATDVSDRIIWNSHNFTEGTKFTTGDFNGDGATDVSDRIIWNMNNFTVAGEGVRAVPVPEPASALLVLSCLGVFARRRRKKT